MQNQQHNKKMFITDLDGTLFTDDKQINAFDLEALEYLGDIGVVRVFATGRSLYSFQSAVDNMGFNPSCEDLPVDYVIFSTGAGIMKCEKETIIKKHSLGSNDVIRIADYFDSLKLDYMIHMPVPDSHYCVYRQQSENPNSDFNLRIEIYRDFIKPINYSKTIKDFGEATELLSIVPSKYGHQTADMIEEALSEFSVIRATSPLDQHSIWIEVFNKMVSKSQAASWLAQQLNVKQENVVAIGNDYNDLDMLKWANKKFFVSNSPKELKEKLVSLNNSENLIEVASNNDCGVAEAIGYLQNTFFQQI